MSGRRKGPAGGPAGPGFTLVEVLVALVVIQVGVLGLAGTLLLAGRTLRDAGRIERQAADLAWVHDSLSAEWSAGAGETRRPWGTLAWTVSGNGRATLTAAAGADTVRMDAWLPSVP